MRTFDSVAGIRAFVRAARQDGKSIGFVPTMGALHEGHLTLMRRARGDCDVVVVSIFVNPKQFAEGEDLTRYPRSLTRDSTLTQQCGVDALFSPSTDQIYPPGDQTVIDPGPVSRRWEGEVRPTHFQGVATVCAKLFQIVCPDRVYFGLKDYQQLKVIERLSADLFFSHTVVPVATVREPDGLALSSRNQYLSPDGRLAATALHRALSAGVSAFDKGERGGERIAGIMRHIIEQSPAVQLDYAAVADSESLEPIDEIDSHAVALIAARVGTTRLIDNMILGQPVSRRSEHSERKRSSALVSEAS